jgi:hypothetical protein
MSQVSVDAEEPYLELIGSRREPSSDTRGRRN